MHRHILLSIALLLSTCSLFAQSVKVTGTVIDGIDGQGMPGVSVSVKNGKGGTQTDSKGTFSLQASPGEVLRFNFLGYTDQEITVKDDQPIKITLQESDNALQEVVVTALGISREKKSLGYAVQEVKGTSLAEAKESNLVNSLSGRVAGLNITNSQGNMGSSRIVIRGETSISGNNQPLFIVDGVPIDNSQLGAAKADGSTNGAMGGRDYANAISDINSEDIESISVLKGPNAAALYGSRAAAGVVIIKTKSGKKGKGMGVSLSSSTTLERILLLPEYQDVFGQGSAGKFSYVDGKGGGLNDGVDESWGPPMNGQLIPQAFSNGVPVPFIARPDNVRSFFETGHTLNNGIAISGGADNYTYRFSYNNTKQKGIVPNTGTNKNALGLNTSFDIMPKLKLNVNANYIRNGADNLPGGAKGLRASSTMLQFLWFGRQVDVEELKRQYEATGTEANWNGNFFSNPYFIANQNTTSQRRDRIFGNAGLTYQIADGLTANFQTGNDYYNDRRKSKVAATTNGYPWGSYQEAAYTVNENNTEARLSFVRQLNEDFKLDVLAGGNLRSRFYESNGQYAERLAVPGLYTLTNSTNPLISDNESQKLKVYSLYSSAQIGFRNYAYLNLTARNDWSSTLPLDNNSYFYPSVSGSFVLNEAFKIEKDWLTYAKLRLGWSQVGKDTDPYQLINTYNLDALFNGLPVQSQSRTYVDGQLKPETTNSLETGLELALLQNRVRLDLSAYKTNSLNQILAVDVSPTSGYTRKLMNAGEIENKGFEMQLGLTPLDLENGFRWDMSINYSLNRSSVLYLDKDGGLDSYVLGSSGGVQVLAKVGESYGSLFGTKFLRDGSGNMVVNASGTPLVDPTLAVLGSFQPKWLGGIRNDFAYKNVSLGFLVDAKVGGKIYSATNSTGVTAGVLASTLPGRDAANGGLPYYYKDDKSENGLTPYTGSVPNNETVHHDGMIFDGVYANGERNTSMLTAEQYYKAQSKVNESGIFSATAVRLREVSLGYNVPKKFLEKTGVASARFSLIGRNLWIIHKDAPNIDPETAFATDNAQGLESLQLPTTRSFGFNLNINF